MLEKYVLVVRRKRKRLGFIGKKLVCCEVGKDVEKKKKILGRFLFKKIVQKLRVRKK